jgi:hypothetical protein
MTFICLFICGLFDNAESKLKTFAAMCAGRISVKLQFRNITINKEFDLLKKGNCLHFPAMKTLKVT